MSGDQAVRITLQGCLSDATALGVAARIRAALANGVTAVHLDCTPDLEFVSGELLGFLAVTAERLGAESNHGVIWHKPPPRLKDLLTTLGIEGIFRFDVAMPQSIINGGSIDGKNSDSRRCAIHAEVDTQCSGNGTL